MPVPTDAMAEEAQRGLDWRAEYGRGGTEIGVARARDIVNKRNLSLETVQRMASYFARHEVDSEAEGWRPGEDGYPSAGRIAWALWGGNPGRAWADQILNSEDGRMDKQAAQGAQRETRAVGNVEVRMADTGSVTVEGYAAVFNEETVIGGMFRERIAPGAFAAAIGRDDVVLLVDHAGQPLARTKSGTLTLIEDERGLKISAGLDLEDPDVRRLVPKMRRGDLDKMSFAFMPTRQSWDDMAEAMPLRTIREASLYDVSIVTTPAYEGTEVGLRSLEDHRRAMRQANFSAVQTRLRMKRNLALKERENG